MKMQNHSVKVVGAYRKAAGFSGSDFWFAMVFIKQH